MKIAPMFSVVIVDYEGAVPRSMLRRKLACLAAQSCKDFEVILLHDGPKRTPYSEDLADMSLPGDIRYIITETRANDWGHTNRDRGIREARGTWIIHTNADNVFYPNLIERLKFASESPLPAFLDISRSRKRLVGIARRFSWLFGRVFVAALPQRAPQKDILIYAILMRGMVGVGKGIRRLPEADAQAILFGGLPVKKGQIDAMQFVMRRELWLKEGGWHDRSAAADGNMYPEFAQRYAVFAVPEILGEHW